jgi:hypothetical protein
MVTRSATYERDRAARYRRTYDGLTIATYEEIKAVQGGMCPICLRAKGISTPLQVDHDHSMEVDGRITLASLRGLLCGRDNNRLGWFEAKQDRILNYLANPPAWSVIARG